MDRWVADTGELLEQGSGPTRQPALLSFSLSAAAHHPPAMASELPCDYGTATSEALPACSLSLFLLPAQDGDLTWNHAHLANEKKH